MTIADLLLVAALAIFATVWWLRSLPGRTWMLAAGAAVALAAGVWGVLDDRWQAGFGAGVALLLLAGLGLARLRRRPPRRGLPWLSGPTVTLMAAGAVAAIVAFPVSPLPKPSGPYPVGVRSFELDDASRPGVFAARSGEPRRLSIRVWYPAGDVRGRRPAPYFSPAEAEVTARSLGKSVGFPPFFAFVKHVRTNSYPDAPLPAGAHDLPTVFYSHGFTSFLGQNTALMEHLASHGYVVVSVQHTYDSTATVFPNGDVAGEDPALAAAAHAPDDPAAYRAQDQAKGAPTVGGRMEGFLKWRELSLAHGGRLIQSGTVWAADRMFVHDRLQAGQVPAGVREVFAAARLDRVGEMGMSFGGATSGTVCLVDRRCAAGINLDGADTPFQAFGRRMPVPFLMFHSDLSHIAQDAGAKAGRVPHSFNEFSYDGLAEAGARPEIVRAQMRGARHLGLSDFSLFMRRPARNPVFGSTPADVMIGAQNDFVLGFFDRYLRGRDNGFPQTQFARYRGWVTAVPNTAVRDWWLGLKADQRAAITARIERLRSPGPPGPSAERREPDRTRR